MTHPLIEFLEARLAEDETQADAVDLLSSHMEVIATHHLPEFAEYSVRWQPKAVRAEVEAKRGILAEHQPQHGGQWNGGEASNYQCCTTCGHADAAPENYPCNVLRWLGQPYQGHEDYQGEWAHA